MNPDLITLFIGMVYVNVSVTDRETAHSSFHGITPVVTQPLASSAQYQDV